MFVNISNFKKTTAVFFEKLENKLMKNIVVKCVETFCYG
jgi:hypothetical protein